MKKYQSSLTKLLILAALLAGSTEAVTPIINTVITTTKMSKKCIRTG
jgi:hypothetical protein